jgi:Ca-activated chloride channel family protein
MRFGDPGYLHLLWLFPVLILFLLWALKQKHLLTEKFLGDELIHKLIDRTYQKKQKIRLRYLALAFLFLALAMAQPQWGYRWEEIHQKGVDIVIALDISNSMLAEDIKPNRLKRAQHKISDLLSMLEGDRIGLVVFAGSAFVQLPLTVDYSAARLFLSAVDTDLISNQGTALGQAIQMSMKAFNLEEQTSKVILLITDGEDQTGNGLHAAKLAEAKGIRIYTIGIGSETGAPIPNLGSGGGFKKDRNGNVILTKLDEITLQKIALKTNGVYVRSVTGDMDLKKIYQENILQKVEKREFKTERRKIWQQRFQWFIFLGLVFMILEFRNEEMTRPAKIRQ